MFGFQTTDSGSILQAIVYFLRHLTKHYRCTDYTATPQRYTCTSSPEKALHYKLPLACRHYTTGLHSPTKQH